MIKTLDEFTAFLKICRKQGVTAVTLDGVSVTLGDLPKKDRDETKENIQPSGFDGLTPEQQIFYSAGPMNENIQG